MITLVTPWAMEGHAEGDTVKDVANIVGSSYRDVLTGTDNDK